MNPATMRSHHFTPAFEPTKQMVTTSNFKILPSGLVRDMNYSGKLNPAQIQKITENYPTYKKASDKTGIPWQVLAAVHFRESNLSTSSIAHGGPFQFDPPPNKGEEEFTVGAQLAADFVKEKSGNKLLSGTTDEVIIKDALWGYNGRHYGSADKSPYVMNGFDDTHQNMRIKGTVLNQNGERVTVDTIDKRLGAYVVYAELLKAFK